MARIKYYINYKCYKYSPRATKLSRKQATKFAVFVSWWFIPLLVVGVPFALLSMPLGISSAAPTICGISFAAGFLIGIVRVIMISEIDTDEYAKQDILRQLEEDKPCEELRRFMEINNISKEKLIQLIKQDKFE